MSLREKLFGREYYLGVKSLNRNEFLAVQKVNGRVYHDGGAITLGVNVISGGLMPLIKQVVWRANDKQRK